MTDQERTTVDALNEELDELLAAADGPPTSSDRCSPSMVAPMQRRTKSVRNRSWAKHSSFHKEGPASAAFMMRSSASPVVPVAKAKVSVSFRARVLSRSLESGNRSLAALVMDDVLEELIVKHAEPNGTWPRVRGAARSMFCPLVRARLELCSRCGPPGSRVEVE